MKAILNQNRRNTRLAASLFFIFCIPLSLWETSVASKIFVAQDPVATANNLLSNEFIFRLSSIARLGGTIIFALMILLFCRLFRPHDKHLTRLMAAFIVITIPIALVLEVFNIAALMTLKSQLRPGFGVPEQQEAAYFLLRMNRFGIGTGKLFYGLCFIPFGMVVLRSGLVPRIIGILILIGAFGYITDFCTYILLQRTEYLSFRSYLQFVFPSYMLALLWFLIISLKRQNQPLWI